MCAESPHILAGASIACPVASLATSFSAGPRPLRDFPLSLEALGSALGELASPPEPTMHQSPENCLSVWTGPCTNRALLDDAQGPRFLG